MCPGRSRPRCSRPVSLQVDDVGPQQEEVSRVDSRHVGHTYRVLLVQVRCMGLDHLVLVLNLDAEGVVPVCPVSRLPTTRISQVTEQVQLELPPGVFIQLQADFSTSVVVVGGERCR